MLGSRERKHLVCRVGLPVFSESMHSMRYMKQSTRPYSVGYVDDFATES